MTSSQALLVNLLAPLCSELRWLRDVLKSTLRRPDLTEVREVAIEFAPLRRSRYLGDMTRVDAFFIVETTSGTEGIVLELKYTDRFSTRKLPIAESPRYRQLAKDSGVWQAPGLALQDQVSAQLLRCHALGLRTLQVDQSKILPVTLLLISHPHDPVATRVFEHYQAHLRDPGGAKHVSLDRWLTAAGAAAMAPDRLEAIAQLRLRYLADEESEPLWRQHQETSQPTARR